MNTNKYELASPLIYQKTGVRFSLTVTEITLNEFAYISVLIYDEEGSAIDSKTLVIEGTEYLGWTDDNQLIDWVRKQLAK